MPKASSIDTFRCADSAVERVLQLSGAIDVVLQGPALHDTDGGEGCQRLRDGRIPVADRVDPVEEEIQRAHVMSTQRERHGVSGEEAALLGDGHELRPPISIRTQVGRFDDLPGAEAVKTRPLLGAELRLFDIARALTGRPDHVQIPLGVREHDSRFDRRGVVGRRLHECVHRVDHVVAGIQRIRQAGEHGGQLVAARRLSIVSHSALPIGASGGHAHAHVVGQRALGRLRHEVQPGRRVRREGESIHPPAVDRRLPTARVLEHHAASLMHPHRGAAAADAGVLFPRECERLPAAEFRRHHDLQVRERPILDLDLRSTLVDELSHAVSVPSGPVSMTERKYSADARLCASESP
jgi:hypothetical protein